MATQWAPFESSIVSIVSVAPAIDSLEAGDLWLSLFSVHQSKEAKTFVRLFLIASNPPTICPRVFYGDCDKNQEGQVRRGLVRQPPLLLLSKLVT